MVFPIFACFAIIELCSGAIQDKTLIPGSHGSEVVEAVVSRIRESCLFPDDKLFLRRLAYVETRDGDDPQTYRPGYDGGIWQIDQQELAKTSSTNTSLALAVNSQFGIDWKTVQWSDLRKPLYSGLAAALYLLTLGEQVPQLTSDQGHYYAKYFGKDATSDDKFSKGAQTFDIVCRRTNLDLAFLVDASTSLSPEDFVRAKEFAHNVVDNFQIGMNDIRVAFVTFSTGFKSQFDFTAYTDKQALQKAIDDILKSEGQTDTNLALDFAAEKLFTPSMGSRDGSSKVILLITDGKSRDGFKTIPAALRARAQGIVIFAIGVGSDVDTKELVNVANKPQCTHVIQLKGYSDLNALVSEIQQVSCKAPAVLNPGTYIYPCSQGGLYQIINNRTTTQVTITVTDGTVNIYGSLTSPTPNEAGHSIYSKTIPSTPSVILLRDDHKQVYMNVSAPSSSNACTGNYTIKIGEVETVKANTHVTCVDFDIARPCSAAEVYAHLYQVVMRPYSSINQCQHGLASFKPHPHDQTKFLYCGSSGTVFVFQCTPHHIYSQYSLNCIPGEPSTTTPTTTVTTTTITTSTTSSTTLTTTSTTTRLPTTTLRLTTTTTPAATTTTRPPTTMTSPTTTTMPTSTSTSTTITTTSSPTTTVPVKANPYTTTLTHLTTKAKSHFQTSTTLIPNFPTSFKSTQKLIQSTSFSANPRANPCTTENIHRNGGLLFYPHPTDKTKYVECTNWPGFGYIKTCSDGQVWNQKFLTCVNNAFVLNPTDNTIDNIPNPCTVTPGNGLSFFPHPTDKHRFIQCDEFGNAYEKVCPDNTIWFADSSQCKPGGLPID